MLTYNNLLDEALRVLPEFRAAYQVLLEKDYLDKDSGNHIVFGYAFVPVLTEAIKSRDRACVERMFAFLEQMAASQDHLVGEVCDFSILEALNDEFDDQVLLTYMGPETRKDFACIKAYML